MRESGSRRLSSPRNGLWRIIRLLGELSLVATIFVMLARIWWFFELFSHFRVQLLVLQLVLLTAFLVLRRPLWAIVIGTASIVNGAAIRDYVLPLGEDTAAADRPADIRVLTANVLASNSDHARLIDLIRSAEPDVFAVLEFTDGFAAAFEDLNNDYPYRVLVPEDGTFGIAVYSKRRVSSRNVFELEGFAAIDAEISDAQGPWHFIAAHTVPPIGAEMAALRNTQLERLSEYVNTLAAPRVVVGDFNLTPFSPRFSDFIEQTSLRNALRGRGPSYTWPGFFPLLGIPIDHVLTSPEFTTVAYHRGGGIGSDHFPVIVDMIRTKISLD
jgi:endonuclease/exonuclease/phosphatase (EEP) superfamily protein YafD